MAFFDNFKSNTRLLIIHPNYRQHKYALANLLGSEAMIYVRFDGLDLTQDELNEQLYSAYQQTAISEIDLLVLDECDRAKKADFDDFLRDLLSHIESIPVVLLSRNLPHLILEDPFIRSISTIWPVNPQIMFPDYLEQNNIDILEAFALGRGYARINGVKFKDWHDTLSQELFFFLVDKGHVHRQEIFDTFWPHLDAKGAANAFQTAKSAINNQLGLEITDYYDGYYSISSQIELYYDVAQYRERIQAADFAPEQDADTLYHEANNLYSGDFLQKIESRWVEEIRNELKKLQADVLANIAKKELRGGNQTSALVYFGRAAKFAPQREDIAYQVLRLSLQDGMPCEALSAYHRLYESLSKLGIKPHQTIESLAEEARQHCSD